MPNLRLYGEVLAAGVFLRTHRRAALARLPERRRPLWVAELDAAGLRRRQRLPGPFRDRLALGLRHQRHDPDGQVVRLGHVHRDEPHPAVAQLQYALPVKDRLRYGWGDEP